MQNNILENKAGYFKNDTKSHYSYLGTISQYKLNDDSVHFLDLSNNKWHGFKVINITKDSLILENRTYSSLKYARKHYTPDTVFKYDQIAVSYYSTWGLGKSILVADNGEIITVKPDTERKRLWTRSNIGSRKIDQLKYDFSIASPSKLKDEYSTGGDDGPEMSITFLKNGEIIKSIHDYMYGAPKELIWAYNHLRYIDQSAKQQPLMINSSPLNLFSMSLTANNKTALLTVSEAFYLCALISQAKETDHLFLKKFKFSFFSNLISKIQSDGQFYQFTYKNGSQKTYDIGFNFIERNASVLKFKDKTNNN